MALRDQLIDWKRRRGDGGQGRSAGYRSVKDLMSEDSGNDVDGAVEWCHVFLVTQTNKDVWRTVELRRGRVRGGRQVNLSLSREKVEKNTALTKPIRGTLRLVLTTS